ncbi:alpha-E domain-containing protein [Sulfurospirillum sp. 1612]|uniref:alpha-E domain-containing protein n=1 Tax=Sulfurospirillum sp. 1612 TaxID=3094835 RepID=UPI002F923D66
MDQLLTANVASNLYWLGRHLDRTEATLYNVIKTYDLIIDVDKDAGAKLYEKFGINLKYKNAMGFLHNAILGNHNNNLRTITANARENAIIARNYINTEMFGEVIALNALFRDATTNALTIDYQFIDHAQSLINEILGELSKRKAKQGSDFFIRLGKLVEEIDFCFRLDKDEALTNNIINEAYMVMHTLAPDLPQNMILFQKKRKNQQEIFDDIYKKIATIIVE